MRGGAGGGRERERERLHLVVAEIMMTTTLNNVGEFSLFLLMIADSQKQKWKKKIPYIINPRERIVGVYVLDFTFRHYKNVPSIGF